MRKDRKLKNWRIGIAFLFICAISAGIIFRLFSLQIIDYKCYSIKAKNQHEFSRTLNPRRGSIFMKDRFGDVYPLAINKDYGAVYVIPNEITDKENTAEKLSQILNVDKEIILNRISKKDDPYEPIKSKISDEELAVIKNETITGVYLSTKESRFYPYEDAASNLVGFVNAPDNEFIGQYGLEKFYDEELAGEKGGLIAEKGIGEG